MRWLCHLIVERLCLSAVLKKKSQAATLPIAEAELRRRICNRTDGKQSLSAKEAAKPLFSQDSGTKTSTPPKRQPSRPRSFIPLATVNQTRVANHALAFFNIGSFQPNHNRNFHPEVVCRGRPLRRATKSPAHDSPKILIRTARTLGMAKGSGKPLQPALAKRRRHVKSLAGRRPQVLNDVHRGHARPAPLPCRRCTVQLNVVEIEFRGFNLQRFFFVRSRNTLNSG